MVEMPDGTLLKIAGGCFTFIEMVNERDDLTSGFHRRLTEANNAICYPALGLGTVISRSKTMSPGMIMAGVQALASLAPPDGKTLLPDLANVRTASVTIAAAVVRKAIEEGHARVKIPESEEVEEYIKKRMWDPVYR